MIEFLLLIRINKFIFLFFWIIFQGKMFQINEDVELTSVRLMRSHCNVKSK